MYSNSDAKNVAGMLVPSGMNRRIFVLTIEILVKMQDNISETC
jgi:hypothetical protein